VTDTANRQKDSKK